MYKQLYCNFWFHFNFHQNGWSRECPLFNKKLTLAQVDTIKEMHDGLTARLGIVVSKLNNIVKKIKETKECYTKCRCSGQRKGLEHLPVKELRVCFHRVSTSYSQTCSNLWHTAERKTTHRHRDGQWRFTASHGWFSNSFVKRRIGTMKKHAYNKTLTLKGDP